MLTSCIITLGMGMVLLLLSAMCRGQTKASYCREAGLAMLVISTIQATVIAVYYLNWIYF